MSTETADVRIRRLHGHDELRRCVDLQRRVWGDDFVEIVPPAILWVAARTGGVVAGAFNEADHMLGFLFGMTGYVDGRPVHWSDMLAVEPAARGRGIGTLLKRYQRDTLLERGILEVSWTFDPLESRNAWLNFAHLGITVREYVRDCYGASSSPLHDGLGTDRLIAHWALDSARVRLRMEGGEPPPTLEQLPDAPIVNDPALRLDLDCEAVRIRIPADVQALKDRDPEEAAAWRHSTRLAFEAYLGRGFEAVELLREAGGTSSYVLVRRRLRDGLLR